MRILIAEDDPVSRTVIERTLAPFGTCETAADGKQALEAYKAGREAGQPFRLLCLDILMPEMDGRAVLQAIRGIEETARTTSLDAAKVLMITSIDDPKTVMSSFRMGCEGYVVKPVDRTKLLEQVRALGLIP